MSLLGGQGSGFGLTMLAKYQLPFGTQEGPTHTHTDSTYDQGFAFLSLQQMSPAMSCFLPSPLGQGYLLHHRCHKSPSDFEDLEGPYSECGKSCLWKCPSDP